jgi:hypothetical protein
MSPGVFVFSWQDKTCQQREPQDGSHEENMALSLMNIAHQACNFFCQLAQNGNWESESAECSKSPCGNQCEMFMDWH